MLPLTLTSIVARPQDGLPVAIAVQPWCDNSIRVRVYPGEVSAGSTRAVLWTNAGRSDSLLCISDECEQAETTSGYTQGDLEGYAPHPSHPDAVALDTWYSHEHTDNFVATRGTQPPDDTYTRAFSNGFALSAPPSDGMALELWARNSTHHTLSVASAASKAAAATRVHVYSWIVIE